MEYKKYDPKLFSLKRKILGLTGGDIASICRCTRQTISNIENGHSKSMFAITFVGYTLDMLAKERGCYETFEILENTLK